MDLDKSVGTGAGIIGSVLVAIPDFALFGFLTWMVGNIAWMHAGIRSNDKYVTILFSFYFITVVAAVVIRVGEVKW